MQRARRASAPNWGRPSGALGPSCSASSSQDWLKPEPDGPGGRPVHAGRSLRAADPLEHELAALEAEAAGPGSPDKDLLEGTAI